MINSRKSGNIYLETIRSIHEKSFENLPEYLMHAYQETQDKETEHETCFIRKYGYNIGMHFSSIKVNRLSASMHFTACVESRVN